MYNPIGLTDANGQPILDENGHPKFKFSANADYFEDSDAGYRIKSDILNNKDPDQVLKAIQDTAFTPARDYNDTTHGYHLWCERRSSFAILNGYISFFNNYGDTQISTDGKVWLVSLLRDSNGNIEDVANEITNTIRSESNDTTTGLRNQVQPGDQVHFLNPVEGVTDDNLGSNEIAQDKDSYWKPLYPQSHSGSAIKYDTMVDEVQSYSHATTPIIINRIRRPSLDTFQAWRNGLNPNLR